MSTIRWVVFDGGDTLIRVFPEYSGSMADWPRVEAMPGAQEALQQLAGKYRLAIASNATDSGPEQVRRALGRAGLTQDFAAILTARELGLRKPFPEFYRAVLDALDCPPGEAAMVGDDAQADASGAKRVGMKAVWLNHSGLPASPPHPVWDAEIRSLLELPGWLASPPLPDIPGCLRLTEHQGLPGNILRHVIAVAGAAYLMAGWLRERGERVDPVLAHRGGLLHDLDKLSAQSAGRQHGDLSAEILAEAGQPELSEIARRHLLYTGQEAGRLPETWEQRLVFYADKIVEGDQLVPLPTRLQALEGRYPGYVERMRACWPQVVELEKQICARLDLEPGALLARLRAAQDPASERVIYGLGGW